jgi:hypothetical protein
MRSNEVSAISLRAGGHRHAPASVVRPARGGAVVQMRRSVACAPCALVTVSVVKQHISNTLATHLAWRALKTSSLAATSFSLCS